jgi:hypothetical protein
VVTIPHIVKYRSEKKNSLIILGVLLKNASIVNFIRTLLRDKYSNITKIFKTLNFEKNKS